MSSLKTLVAPLFIAALAAACGVLAFTLDSYSLLVFTLCALAAVVGVGLNILIGLSGQISFGGSSSQAGIQSWDACPLGSLNESGLAGV